MTRTKLTARPSQRCQTSQWEVHQAGLNLSPKVEMWMSLLVNMMTVEGSILMLRASKSLKSEKRELLRLWVQVPTTLTELTVKPSLKRPISTWDKLPVVQPHLQGVVMSMLRLASMMTAENSVTMPRASRFLRRDSKESLRQWVREPMTWKELMVRLSLKRPISI